MHLGHRDRAAVGGDGEGAGGGPAASAVVETLVVNENELEAVAVHSGLCQVTLEGRLGAVHGGGAGDVGGQRRPGAEDRRDPVMARVAVRQAGIGIGGVGGLGIGHPVAPGGAGVGGHLDPVARGRERGRRLPGQVDLRCADRRRRQVRRRAQDVAQLPVARKREVGEGRRVIAGEVLNGGCIVALRGIAVAHPDDLLPRDHRVQDQEDGLSDYMHLGHRDRAAVGGDGEGAGGGPAASAVVETLVVNENELEAVAVHSGLCQVTLEGRRGAVHGGGAGDVGGQRRPGAEDRRDPVMARVAVRQAGIGIGGVGGLGIGHPVAPGGAGVGGHLDPVARGRERGRRLPGQVDLRCADRRRRQVRRRAQDVAQLPVARKREVGEGRRVIAGEVLNGGCIVALRGIAVAHPDDLLPRDHRVQDQEDGLSDYMHLGHRDRAAVGGDGEGAGGGLRPALSSRPSL